MCTLTLHKNADHILVTMNRDEAVNRPQEKPPYIWDDPQLIAPADTQAGGTWIAARGDGFWACLLNGYLEDKLGEVENAQSRGRIIPDILSQDDPLAAIGDMDLAKTNSFRLLIGNSEVFSEYFWDQSELLSVHEQTAIQNLCVVSSSWKQDEVTQYRRDIHQSMSGENWESGVLPAFHRFQDEGMDEWTPLMKRSYAKTKSITQLVIPSNDDVCLALYYWAADALDSDPIHLSL